MFEIGWSELLVIAVVALIAIGPKELPGVLRSLSHWMGKIRQMAAEFQSQFQEAMREAEMADLKKHADDLNDATRMLTGQFDAQNYLQQPDTGATNATSAAEAGDPGAAPAAANQPVDAPAQATSPQNPSAASAIHPDAVDAADSTTPAEREAIAPASGGRSA